MDVGVQVDFGFSFHAVPTIDTVLYFEGLDGRDGGKQRGLRTQVQIGQTKLIFEYQKSSNT